MNREVLIAQDSANNILEDSNKYEHVETGGLLFGKNYKQIHYNSKGGKYAKCSPNASSF